MRQLTSLDLYFMRQELLALVGAKVDKIYQPDASTLIFQLHKDGKKLLKISLPSLIFVSTTKSAGEQLNFAKFLRNNLNNYRLASIEQKNFERILELTFSFNEDRKIIIVELFSKGNVILCTKEYLIISSLSIQKWKDRTIKKNDKYVYPPKNSDSLSLNFNKFSMLVKASNKESIVKILAIDFSLGGTYAEETCFLAEIDKSKKLLTDKEIRSLHDALQKIISKKTNANISNGEAFPFELETCNKYSKEYFDTFSQAIESCIENQPKQAESKEQKKLLNLLEIQKKQLEQIKYSTAEETDKGNLIYNNYQPVSSLLLSKDVKNLEQNPMVSEINKKDKTFAITLDSKKIVLCINESIEKNAAKYYERAKRIKNKIPGAERAINSTSYKISRLQPIQQESRAKPLERKREWYEKFRWFISSEGLLVIGGKDATTNDIIIKKYLEKNDLVFHTELKGSPFVVIKSNGKPIGNSTIKEAAIFCASNTSQWSAKLATSDVYYVTPEQVKKEFGLPKGAFMIHGKRTYLKPILELAVGIIKDNKVMCGPLESVKSNCKISITVKQGYTKKSDIAKKIKKRLEGELKIKLNLDDIMQVLPPGDSSI